MEDKHTKGPLHLNHNEGYQDIILGPDYIVAKCRQEFTGIEEGFANAKLFCAAFNAFDSAAFRLGISAVQLAEVLQDGRIAELVELLQITSTNVDSDKMGMDQFCNLGKISRTILAKIRKEGE